MEKKPKILEEYKTRKETLDNFLVFIKGLVGSLISSSDLSVHSVTGRVKNYSSLESKIDKKEKYDCLDDITDVVGIRVITNYSDEVKKIAEIIEREFLIDENNSIDKSSILETDRFGYLSLHYVAQLTSKRSSLVENRHYKGINFEIQIRSILQHTWAEIEHDIGYKTNIEVPKNVRRKFSMLAGLLELADEQFINVRNEILAYQKKVSKEIKKSTSEIGIDSVSIFQFYTKNSNGIRIEKEVSKNAESRYPHPKIRIEPFFYKSLGSFGIYTISDLENALRDNKEAILGRARSVAAVAKGGISSGASSLYLCQTLAVKGKPQGEALKSLCSMGYSNSTALQIYNSFR